MSIDGVNMYKKNITRSLFSTENIKYSLIFLILFIIFEYLLRTFLIRDLILYLERAEMFPPSEFWKIILYSLFLVSFTPFITVIFKRKYEIIFLGYFIPALIIAIFIQHADEYGIFYLWEKVCIWYGYFPWWSLCEIIPVFILIYLLRRSVSLRDDIIGIISFCLIYSAFSMVVFLHFFSCPSAYCPRSSFFFSSASFGIFGALYLILLSFTVEKIVKIKIFRQYISK